MDGRERVGGDFCVRVVVLCLFFDVVALVVEGVCL